MKEVNHQYTSTFGQKSSLICMILALVLLLTACGAGSLTGRPRTASPEEAEFFRSYVRSDNPALSGDDLDLAAEKAANTFSATMELGSELGLCGHYSFEGLQQDWTKENEDRARKQQSGEVYYGPGQLSFESYFRYYYSTLQADLMTALLDGRDAGLVMQAREFYEENPEAFTRVASVRFRITENGTVREQTVGKDEFRALGQSDPMLMDFLSNAADGEETVLGEGESARHVVRLGVTMELMDFVSYERTIVEVYLTSRWIPEQLDLRIRDNPIVF